MYIRTYVYYFFFHTLLFYYVGDCHSKIFKLVKRYILYKRDTFDCGIIFLDSCILRDVLQSVLGRHNRG